MDKNALAYMEVFFAALADKTRLRLLNLMRDREICVYFFTEVLGSSQPKISRHLAYLRNAGVVTARREGKWMYYRIIESKDEGRRRVLGDVLDWLDSREDLRRDWAKYELACSALQMPEPIVQTPAIVASANAYIFRPRNADEGRPAHNELEEFLL